MPTIITDPDAAPSEIIGNIIKEISGTNTVLTSEVTDMLLDLMNHSQAFMDEYSDLSESKQKAERELWFYRETFGPVEVPVDYIVPWLRAILTPEGLAHAQQVRRDRAKE